MSARSRAAFARRMWPVAWAASTQPPTPPSILSRSSSPVCVSFFFSSRRRHTRLVSDWSSDVCSSDLRPMASVLPPRRTRVTYSGVVTAGSVERAVQHARRMRAIGMRHVKVKVGFDDDVARVTAVREALGPGVTLRLDANGAWTFERAVAVLDAVAPLGIAAVEQPLPRGPVDDLARLRQATPVPVMVDESLVTEADADALIEAKAADFFNVRISKCGGLARSLAIAARGSAVGVGVQVGSQVGETAILSAAGRHLAAALPEVTFVDGSFGTLLLAEDVSVEIVRFGHRGEAPLLTGPGLGIRVVEERLRRRAITVRELSTEG